MTITWKETAKRRRTQYGRTNENSEVRDVIEAFYDCMIEKILNYIGAE